ncbi:hypothetical protein WME94_12570 [Sorangium sp. So ce429]
MSPRLYSNTLSFFMIAARQRVEPTPSDSPPAPPAHPLPPAAQAEPWASRPPREWPQLALTNSVEFHVRTALQGASAFLIKAQDGRTLAATAKHLLGPNGGVEPEVSVASFDGAIRS